MKQKRIVARRIEMRKTVMEMTPFYVVEVFERAEELERQGRSIIHLEVGEPDFPTCMHALTARRPFLGVTITPRSPFSS
jgi:aspartate/methionine/tyrosine aminotransferase